MKADGASNAIGQTLELDIFTGLDRSNDIDLSKCVAH